MSNYTTFKKFPDAAEAKHLQQFLIENGIECTFVNNSPRLDNSFSGGELLKEYEIQLKQSDFEKAHELLEQLAEDMMSNLDEDYYMYSFSNEELYDVVLKQDEWSEFDYVLARKLLAQRGKAIDDAEISKMRMQRLVELARPEKNHRGWIIAGYIAALAGGFFGIIIGYVIWSSKKTLPNGSAVHTYTKEDRSHGRIILIIGAIVLPFAFMFRLLSQYLSNL